MNGVMDRIEMKRELAGRAFSVAIRMLSEKKKISKNAALIYVAGKLGRDVLQMSQYTVTGLPIYLVEPAITLFRNHGVIMAKHQLRPTDDVLKIHLT
ncbi:hypothetical protein LZS85_15715 [Aliivibrio fischeri]|uniref:hypothetical protein n=1 Tax=Aliivibrio fischeri TaxID=668 RepID=UPI001F488633|nr:hypothetical protein [Aliivibrio fischeri]MCE7567571.1 hypothetical protein [Aliivibrio fischeri]